MSPDNNALSDFIRLREYEYAVAVQLCSRGCGSLPTAVVGKERAGPAARNVGAALDRDFSVESTLGGYGLYYRTPLTDLQVVAPRGTLLGEHPTQVDVLRKDDRARRLAASFRAAIADTDYYRHHMFSPEPIPVAALRQFGERACLCRLAEWPEERRLIRESLLGLAEGLAPQDVERRRHAFALFLHLLDRDPRVAFLDDAFREAIWQEFVRTQGERTILASVVSRWAALVAKEYLQEAFSSIWSHFCRLGHERQASEGFDRGTLAQLVRAELIGAACVALDGEPLPSDPGTPTATFASAFAAAAADHSLEELRAWAADADTAMAGLALLLLLYQRLPDRSEVPAGWTEIGAQRSGHQPGLIAFGQLLSDHMAGSPTLADTVAWLVYRFILDVHEAIGYSRLPNNVFRFRWERGRLRFFDNGLWRFDLADNRRDALARLSEDLGFWQHQGDGAAAITDDGRRLVEDVLR